MKSLAMFFIHATLHEWLDAISLELFVGGMIGGFIRALAGRGPTWERLLALHIASGAATAVMVPNIYRYFLKAELIGAPLFWVGVGMFVGLFGNYIVVAILWHCGVFKNDPRASRMHNGNGETKP